MPISRQLYEYESHPHDNIVLHRHSDISWVAYGYSATLLHALRSNIPIRIRHFVAQDVDLEAMVIDALSVQELLSHLPASENTTAQIVISFSTRGVVQ